MRTSGTDLPELERGDTLAFIPDRPMSEAQLRRLLAEGSPEMRAWAVTRLLQFAEWDEIWAYVTRDQVGELFPLLDLPPKLRAAWARLLRLDEAVPSER
jgi:hypothetical protein